MSELPARKMMDEGKNPNVWQQQQADAGNPEALHQTDFIGSPEFQQNQENQLRDPKEIERRRAAKQPIPQWARDHYDATEGQRRAAAQRISSINQDRSLQNERLVLPVYSKQKLQDWSYADLLAVARNYQVEVVPGMMKTAIIDGILAKQELPAESFEQLELLPEPGEDDTYVPAEAAKAPPAIQRAPTTAHEALEYDAQEEAKIAQIKADRKDREIQERGPKGSLLEAVGPETAQPDLVKK